ncbi:MAG TPA: hypothetical protein VFT22_40155 [Kofleriaceae bacterium]|nr:hypothetical protein [Kofleriaceae bacterium]
MTKNLVQRAHEPRRAVLPYASARWVAARGLHPPSSGEPWKVTILLDVVNPRVVLADTAVRTRLQIVIESFEWSVFFTHGSGASWIRVTDAPRVHERDDFGLLPHVTELRNIGRLVQWLEQRFKLEFRRPHAVIHTNLVDAQQNILLWIVSSL